MYADHLLQPWLASVLRELPDPRIFDAHTHVGQNDPSGFTATWDELLVAIELVDGRAAVFPLAEPEGYREANLDCARAAARTGGRLVAFARLTPNEAGLLPEAMAAGAKGIKLHLSSDDFELEDPRLAEAFEIADERSLPVVVHAGPEVSSVGESALKVCARWPGVRLVLAHCALTDLAWLWRRVPEAPNLFFDTSWWTPAHLLALFRLVPPGRILNGSDLPYSTPLSHTLATARCGWQAGLTPSQISSVIGGQLARLVDGDEPMDLGPPPEAEPHPPGPLLEIVSTNLLTALEALQRGEEPGVPLTVARHGCQVPDDDPDVEVFASVLRLLDLYEQQHQELPKRNRFSPGWDLVAAAAVIARTPAAPLP